MEARDWIEWGTFALPGVLGLASGVLLTFSKPTTTMAKTAWFVSLGICVLLVSTLNYLNQTSARTANIKFEIGSGRSFLFNSPFGTYARVRVNNRSWQEATCRLYLTDLERIGDTSPIMTGDKILMAAANTGGEGYKERLIGPNNYFLFDIAYILQEKEGLLIQSLGDQFLAVHPYPLPRGDYRFTIGTDGKNCTSAPYEVTVRYEGWPNLSFLSGK